MNVTDELHYALGTQKKPSVFLVYELGEKWNDGTVFFLAGER